jgi:hypothetical protein
VAKPAAHRIADRARLLKDFLEHVVRIIALFDVGVGELDLAQLIISRLARDRTDFEFVAIDRDDVEVVQIYRVPRVGDDGADVAGQEILILAYAEDERAAAAGSDDEVRNIAMDQSNPVRADDLAQGGADGIDQTALLVRQRGLAI